jgi:hypothetical protein
MQYSVRKGSITDDAVNEPSQTPNEVPEWKSEIFSMSGRNSGRIG